MKGSCFKGLLICLLTLLSLWPARDAEAAVYTDSLTFKIDSAKVEGDYLIYSVMFWRTNRDWTGGGLSGVQDTMLGNTDLYFRLEDVVFDKMTMPSVLRHHPHVDLTTVGGMQNVMELNALYYAYRFAIKLKPKPSLVGATQTVGIPYNQPVELCQVRLKMANPAQNPGLVWDVKATGGQSTIGEPLILTLQGDIEYNPKKDIVLVDYSRRQYVCEGGKGKIWAKGHSQKDGLKIAWYMSDKPDCIAQTANGNGLKFSTNVTGNLVSGQIHHAGALSHPKWGTLQYEITCGNDGLERVDTLTLLNVPISLDSIYFQCELSDPTTGSAPRTSVNDPANPLNVTQLLVRDSIHGWFAASDPSMRDDHATTDIGASDRTDTVLKCPTTGAILSFYFFGPECNTDQEIIGNKMMVEYQWQDMLGGGGTGTYEVTSWQVVPGQTDPVKGRCLYRGTVLTADTITDKLIWVRSIATEAGCLNGSNYPPYDTLYIRDIPQDQTLLASITDTTLSSGESMVLNNVFSSAVLKQPARGSINVSTNTYYAPNTSCSDPNGCSDTIIYTYNITDADGSTCPMELQQVVNLADWYYLNLKVLLEGDLMNSATGEMKGAIVSGFPLDPNGSGKYSSPYNTSSLISVLPNPASGKRISDWIQISLRDPANFGQLYESVIDVSAFVLIDGTICDSIGNAYVRFKNLKATNAANEREYYVLVHHRNHIGVMSALPVKLTTSTVSMPMVDFTNINSIYHGNAATVNGKAALYAGMTVPNSGVVNSSSLSRIKQDIASGLCASSGYYCSDINMDGVVNANDVTRIKDNVSKSIVVDY